MTPYDEIIDLALVSLEDYRLNKLAKVIDEENFDMLSKSETYQEYYELCGQTEVTPIREKDYNKIKTRAFMYYGEYVENALSDLTNVIEGFMIRGLPNFTNCKKDLSNRDDNARVFNIGLTDLEKSIIADWTVLTWLDKEINDVRQITGMIQNKVEANRYSEANLLKEKTNHKVQLQEDVNKKQTEYDFLNIPWKDWMNGDYGV